MRKSHWLFGKGTMAILTSWSAYKKTLWLSIINSDITSCLSATGVVVHMALQHVFSRSTCRPDKWVLTANVTLLWQSDTTPGLLLSPRGVFMWERALPLFYDKDVTFPELCLCERATERERESHDSTTAEAHQWNSLSCLNPSNGISHTHTHVHINTHIRVHTLRVKV